MSDDVLKHVDEIYTRVLELMQLQDPPIPVKDLLYVKEVFGQVVIKELGARFRARQCQK